MKLIVGLGNPGSQYAGTRHNAGFMVLEELAQRYGLSGGKTRFHAGVLEGVIADERCMLMQPTTFMNRSGLAVGEAMNFYKLAPADLMVVVDDVALPAGSIRLRPYGSAGGHNGLKDIQRVLGTHEYPRLRVGVDEPGQVPRVAYVLGKFTAEQMERLTPVLSTACDAIECWIKSDIQTAMNKYNG